jgi:serine/threonine-protein kinase ULK/ATG1
MSCTSKSRLYLTVSIPYPLVCQADPFAEPLADPAKFLRRDGEHEKVAIKRHIADKEAESTAVTTVAVYMLLMSFSQKGIDKLRNFQEHLRMRHPDGEFEVSEGFDDGMFYFCIQSTAQCSCSEQSSVVVQGALHQM